MSSRLIGPRRNILGGSNKLDHALIALIAVSAIVMGIKR
jgi:hypothetical protein